MTGSGTGRAGWRPPSTGAGYIAIILGTELLVMLLSVLPGVAGWGPELLQLVAYATGLVLGVHAWVRYRPRRSANGLLRAFLVLALALWLLDAGRLMNEGADTSVVFLTVPLLLILIWIRPPDAGTARWTLDAVSIVMIAIILGSLVMEVTHLVPSWYVIRDGLPVREFDNASYWLPLTGPLGLDGRWAGPFPHPNMAGPTGAFLMVFAMCRSGWLRWTALVTGGLVLLLTSSRTSSVAALVATLIVLVVMAVWRRPDSVSGWLALLAAPVLSAMIVAGAVVLRGAGDVAAVPSEVADRFGTLTGRTSIWPIYLDIWRESPWVGSPNARIEQAQADGVLPGWAHTAHNLLLDSLVRLGILGTTLVVALFVVVGALGVVAARRGSALSIGTVAVLLVCSVAEVLVFWRMWAVSTILLLLAVLAAMEVERAPLTVGARPPGPAPVPGSDPGPGREPSP